MNPDMLRALDVIIEEGNAVEGFLSSDAWRVIRRTVVAQVANYKDDCYEAAKDGSKNIAAFLGRMEALEWLVSCIEHDFVEAKNRALAEKQSAEALDRETAELDQAVADGIGGQVFQPKPGTI